MMPARGDFKSLYDALQLGACNVTAPTEADEWSPPVATQASRAAAKTILTVDVSAPSGTFGSLEAAVAHSRTLPSSSRPVRIELRGGVHQLERTLTLRVTFLTFFHSLLRCLILRRRR